MLAKEEQAQMIEDKWSVAHQNNLLCPLHLSHDTDDAWNKRSLGFIKIIQSRDHDAIA